MAEGPRELVQANRIVANEGIVDAFGHMSLRDPGRRDGLLIARSIDASCISTPFRSAALAAQQRIRTEVGTEPHVDLRAAFVPQHWSEPSFYE